MTELYLLDTCSMEDPLEHPEWKTLMTKQRWERTVGRKGILGRRECAAAGALLSYLFQVRGLPGGEKDCYVTETGKPEHDKICFSLSHSGGRVICAIADRPVGCDVQIVKPVGGKVIERYYTGREKDYIRAASDEKEQTMRAVRLWTLRESYVKMTGDGLARGLSGLSFDIGESVRACVDGQEQKAECIVFDWKDSVIALCGGEKSCDVKEVSWRDVVRGGLAACAE